jgi:hypothetical protein
MHRPAHPLPVCGFQLRSVYLVFYKQLFSAGNINTEIIYKIISVSEKNIPQFIGSRLPAAAGHFHEFESK